MYFMKKVNNIQLGFHAYQNYWEGLNFFVHWVSRKKKNCNKYFYRAQNGGLVGCPGGSKRPVWTPNPSRMCEEFFKKPI